MAVRYSDLITPAELKAAALGDDAGKAIDSHAAAVESLIRDVTALIETYLDRQLIAHPSVQRFPARTWSVSQEHEDYSFEAWARDWPVFEITTSSVVAGSASAGGQLLYSNSASQTVEGYAGYRRRDQNLAALQAAEDDAGGAPLAEMTELPPALPGDIRSCALNLCLAAITQRREGMIGRSRKTQSVGQAVVTVDSIDRQLVERELSRIRGYRRMP